LHKNTCSPPEEHKSKNDQLEKAELENEDKLIQNEKCENIKHLNFSISNNNDCYLNERSCTIKFLL